VTDIDGTDYCGHCRRVTGNRVDRQSGRTAFLCVECGRETDAYFDDDEPTCAECGCAECGCAESECECGEEE
jgi:hypothetical protein